LGYREAKKNCTGWRHDNQAIWKISVSGSDSDQAMGSFFGSMYAAGQ
jgi:hypothetical protein